MRPDIGAQGLKPLFIAGCTVTTIFLDLAFAAERYLRHTGRLAKNLGRAEKVLSALSSAYNCPPAQAWKIPDNQSDLCYWRHVRPDTAIDFRYCTTSAIARWFPLVVYVCCHSSHSITWTTRLMSNLYHQSWLRHQRHFRLRRISTLRCSSSPAPRPPSILLDEAGIHSCRTCVSQLNTPALPSSSLEVTDSSRTPQSFLQQSLSPQPSQSIKTLEQSSSG